MQATPQRYLNAALWPLTVWPSLLRFEDHAADDYVERTIQRDWAKARMMLRRALES